MTSAPSLFNLLGYPGFVLLGIGLLAAAALVYRPRPDDPEDEVHLMLMVAGRSMIGSGFVGACIVVLGGFGIIFALAAFCVLAYASWRYRKCRELSLLKMLSTAADKAVPLPAAVEAFAQEWRGSFEQRVRRLAALLRSGVGLTDALRQSE